MRNVYLLIHPTINWLRFVLNYKNNDFFQSLAIREVSKALVLNLSHHAIYEQ